MRIAMLASASAMAFVFAISAVSAADQFTTLKGVKAVPMSALELSAVRGMDHHFFILSSPDNPNAIQVMVGGVLTWVLDPAADTSTGPLATDGRFSTDWKQDVIEGATPTVDPPGNFVSVTFPTGARVVSPAYNGLKNACGNGTIEGPGFLC